MFDIKEELKKLPSAPGVYIMRDARDEILYVGKAKILKNRVPQYFRASSDLTTKIRMMVSRVSYFEYIVVDSEMEALALECNLIKEHRPRYNTLLKDDKQYPYIRVTVNDDFPRVEMVHRQFRDHAKYFGPYMSSKSASEVLEMLRRIYPFRTCTRAIAEGSSLRPCVYNEIGQCKAPCGGRVTKEEYRGYIDGVMEYLGGNMAPMLKNIEAKMKAASEALEFEAAAMYRDMATSVRNVAEKQKITQTDDSSKDVIAFAANEGEVLVAILIFRNGHMIGRESFFLNVAEDIGGPAPSTILSEFIKRYYSGALYIPKELLVPCAVSESAVIEAWLSNKRGNSVSIVVPKRGEKEHLVELCANNAQIILKHNIDRLQRERSRTTEAVGALAALLGIAYPTRLESYDISHISGFESVGSMVVFEHGKPKKSDYRKFRIRDVQGNDDYASMREVLTRRFTHSEKANKIKGTVLLSSEKYAESSPRVSTTLDSFDAMPDLILMDGGRGQVNICEEVLSQLGIEVNVCGMVKDDRHRTRGIYFKNLELEMDLHSEYFALVTRIQDETHRFAIEYHRSLRGKAQVHSILDDIPHIGSKRRLALMKHFASIDDIRSATLEQLCAAPGMNAQAAQAVMEFFKA